MKRHASKQMYGSTFLPHKKKTLINKYDQIKFYTLKSKLLIYHDHNH